VFPIITYSNAYADKAKILSDNKNKSGIYKCKNLSFLFILFLFLLPFGFNKVKPNPESSLKKKNIIFPVSQKS